MTVSWKPLMTSLLFFIPLTAAIAHVPPPPSSSYGHRPPPPPQQQKKHAPYVVYSKDGKDITNAILTDKSPFCKSYTGQYYAYAHAMHQNNQKYTAYLTVTTQGNECVFTSNAIPNHTFNNGSIPLPNKATTQYQKYTITQTPKFSGKDTELYVGFSNAVMLNGVKVDLRPAACYGVDDGRKGCTPQYTTAWRYNPAYRSKKNPDGLLVLDQHNGHVQPDGTYHYHATPNALFSDDASTASPVIGFAADGFPIYGSYIQKNGAIVKVRSSYQLKKGQRPSGGLNPGGTYNGMFINDYQYVAGSGDLDECNGMTRNGHYAYYVTEQYPYILNCFKGTPNPSFRNQLMPPHRHRPHGAPQKPSSQ